MTPAEFYLTAGGGLFLGIGIGAWLAIKFRGRK